MELEGSNFIIQAALAFGGGVLAFLSPCVLPLVPAYLGMMSGYSMSDIGDREATRSKMLRVSSLFVGGFSLVFVALGAAATTVSRFLNTRGVVIDRLAGLLIVGFGVLMVGMVLFPATMGGPWMRERRFEARPDRLGVWTPPVMGMAFGFGWTPCIGPILGAVLAMASASNTVPRGMLLLAFFSLGMGVPLVLAGIGMGRLVFWLKRFRRWMAAVNVLAGATMIWFGIMLFQGRVGELAGFFQRLFESVPWLDRLAAI